VAALRLCGRQQTVPVDFAHVKGASLGPGVPIELKSLYRRWAADQIETAGSTPGVDASLDGVLAS
jgi:hypothetical protein